MRPSLKQKTAARPHARRHGGTLGGTLMRRAEAARLLGTSETTLRRLQAAGKLSSVLRNGAHLFDLESVRRLREARSTELAGLAPGSNDGELAAQVFHELGAGTSPVLIVEQLKIAPSVLKALLSEWHALWGGLYLSAADLARLGTVSPHLKRLREQGAPPLDAVIAIVEASSPPCERCNKPATVCAMHARHGNVNWTSRPAPPTAPDKIGP